MKAIYWSLHLNNDILMYHPRSQLHHQGSQKGAADTSLRPGGANEKVLLTLKGSSKTVDLYHRHYNLYVFTWQMKVLILLKHIPTFRHLPLM